MQKNYQISFYVPTDYCETVKKNMFKAGAGSIGNYEACSWQVLGEGQFRPMKGSTPSTKKSTKIPYKEISKITIIPKELFSKLKVRD